MINDDEAFDSKENDEFDKFLEKKNKEFQEFQDKRDNEFMNFLKKQWAEFQLFQGLERTDEPKPVTLPAVDKEIDEKPVITQGNKIKPVQVPEYKPVTPATVPKPTPPIKIEGTEALELSFYGEMRAFYYDPKLKTPPLHNVDKDSIADFWVTMARCNYNDLISQIQRYQNELSLNDWGYYLLVHDIGQGMYGDLNNQVNLFVWFILVKSGYDARIAYNGNAIYVFVSSENTLYGRPYLTLTNKRFYALSPKGDISNLGSLFTYQGDYPGQNRLLDLNLKAYPKIKPVTVGRELRFDYRHQSYTFPVQYDRKLIDFFEFYPQTDLEVYFDASISDTAGASLVKALKPIVEGKSETEAVNILLRFVQTAFEYKTDDMQFGREKYFLPEETLFYPYSDCEDRSVLFAYLVREITGLEVIGLDYPGHVSTAVKFSDDLVQGEYVVYEHKKYVICDPTYIRAGIGMVMPQHKNVTPNVVKINK